MEDNVKILKYKLLELVLTTQELREDLEKISTSVRKHRNRELTAKGVGFGINCFGTALTITGFCLAPITMGASFTVSIVGASVGGAGTVVSVGARIGDSIMQGKHFKAIQKLQKGFLEKKKEWFELLNKCPDIIALIKTLETAYHYHIRQAHVTQWLKLKLFTDDQISLSEIAVGDHIYRKLSKGKGFFSPILYHHGVCVGVDVDSNKMIADFDPDGVKIGSLHNFALGIDHVYRRTYDGDYGIPVEKTIKLAFTLVENGSWAVYHLVFNNCEHFATHLKLQNDQPWSGQERYTRKLATKLANNAPTVVSQSGEVMVDIAAIAIPTTKTATKIASSSLSGALATASVVVSPIATIIDGGMLAWDLIKRDTNQENVDFAINTCDEQIEIFEEYLQAIILYEHNQTVKKCIF